MRISDRHILCIDGDERSVRLVEARLSRSGVWIKRAVQAWLPAETNPRDPAALGEFIRATLAEHHIRTRRAIVDIPRQDAVLNLLSLPSAPNDELAAMVHIQIAKELSFNKDEAVIDFAARREAGHSTCDVWVAAVRNSVIDHYTQVMTAAGLRLERIGLRPFANVVAMTAADPAPGRMLIVDVGPAMTEIDVVHDGHLVYSRAASVSVPPGGLMAAGTAAVGSSAGEEEAGSSGPMEALLVEVSRTLGAYRATDPGARIDRIVLAGTGGVNEAVARVFEDRFGPPTAIFQVPPALQWRGSREQEGTPFSAAIGLALSSVADSRQYFDLLHPKEPEAESRERARRVPLIAATVALFIAAAGVLAYYPILSRHREIAQIQDQIEELRKGSKARDEIIKNVQHVQGWADATALALVDYRARSAVFLDQLERLGEVFPSNKDGYITRLEFKEGGVVEMELAVRDEEVATKLLRAPIVAIQDVKGRQVFDAAPGTAEARPKDKDYGFTDTVSLQVLALKPPEKGKKKK